MTHQAHAARHATIRNVQADEPDVEAESMGRDTGAEVVRDLRSAERAVRDRVEAGRRSLGDPERDRQLLARAEPVRAAAAVPPPISAEQVGELRRLAGELSRAARIRQRTEARFTEVLQARLAASAGVAIHPDAIRAAARGVTEAEELVAVADTALADLGDHPPLRAPAAPPAAPPVAPPIAPPTGHDAGYDAGSPPGPPPAQPANRRRLAHAAAFPFDHAEDEDPVLQRPHDVFDELALDKRRATIRGLAVFLLLAGAGLAAIALGQPTLGGVLVLVAAAAGAFVAVRGHRAATSGEASRLHAETTRRAAFTAEPADPEDTAGDGIAEPLATEPAIASSGAPDPPAPRATEPAEAQDAVVPATEGPDDGARLDLWMQQRTTLLAARAEAIERVRLAVTRWHQLAGADADPHDPEPVVRAHDPQLSYDPQVAEDSPTVRTVAAYHRSVQARWRVLWASVGVDDPPEPENLDDVLRAMLTDSDAAAEALRQLEAAEARMAARAVVSRPLVLVEPRDWISDGRLAQLLASIPPEGEAVLVERATGSP